MLRHSIQLLTLCSFAVFSEVNTTIQVAENKGELRINTADYYSWNTRTDVFTFTHAKAAEFSHLLRSCISAYGRIQINDQLNMIVVTDEPNKLKDILELCRKLDVPEMKSFVKITSEVLPVSYSQPSTLLPYLQRYLSVEGSLLPNDMLNYIAITDHPEVIARVKSELSRFDLPPRQVEFKVHVAEVYKDDGLNAGTDWNQLFNIVEGQVQYSKRYDSQKSEYDGIEGKVSRMKNTNLNANVILNPDALGRFIQLMIEKKQISLVAENTLICVNNSEARFSCAYGGKTLDITLKPSSVNDETLKLWTQIMVDGRVLLENSTFTNVGKSTLLLRFAGNNAESVKKTVPLLGNVLPFIFSKDSKNKSVQSVDIVCTPVLQTSGR